MKKMLCATILLASASLATPAAAQPDRSADPHYGSVSLEAGFQPDPHYVDVAAGGSQAASSVGSSCRGYISRAPDYRLNYTAGQYPLIISVNSNVDTTLVVNSPNSSWHCNDDGGNGPLNPSLRFNRPASGVYEIWVGAFNRGDNRTAARLTISEGASQ